MITDPYSGCRGRWLKTALHLHTNRSDGKDDPATTLAHYRELGFAAVAITDHDRPWTEIGLRDGLVVLPGNERSEGAHHIGEIGCLRIANHPTWNLDHWTVSELMQRSEFHAMEIYNGVVEWLPGAAECADLWDKLLSTGMRIQGVAADDAHAREHRNQGWVQVDSEPDPAAIEAALIAGRFTASTGVEIHEVGMKDGAFTVVTDEPCEIRFIIERGQLRHRVRGANRASYEPQAGDGYVRAELRGADGRRAWTNPVWIEHEASRKRLAEHAQWYRRHLGLPDAV